MSFNNADYKTTNYFGLNIQEVMWYNVGTAPLKINVAMILWVVSLTLRPTLPPLFLNRILGGPHKPSGASERKKIICPAGNRITIYRFPVRILVTILTEQFRIPKKKLFLFKCSLLFNDAVSTYL
jgi:hypothetical protein